MRSEEIRKLKAGSEVNSTLEILAVVLDRYTQMYGLDRKKTLQTLRSDSVMVFAQVDAWGFSCQDATLPPYELAPGFE